MGLDLALAGIVLVTAIRGWFKGFMVQAIRLAAFVASVYVAAPLRDEIKSRAMEYLPTIPPQIVDRLLWWSALAISYVLLTGVASFALAIVRRQTYGNTDKGRGDQFAGFGLSMVKGAIMVAFLLSSLQKHGEKFLGNIPMAQEQTRESLAWKFNGEYQPADKIWAFPPVQLFVNQVTRMGMTAPESSAAAPAAKDEVSARTEGRAPKLRLHAQGERGFNPADPLNGDFGAPFKAIQDALQTLGAGSK